MKFLKQQCETEIELLSIENLKNRRCRFLCSADADILCLDLIISHCRIELIYLSGRGCRDSILAKRDK